MKNVEIIKKHIEMLKCNCPYKIRGSYFHGVAPLISHEIWEMENLLMNPNLVGPQTQEVELEDNGKAEETLKTDYGYIEVEKVKQALIYSLENFLKDYCWQNALIVNNLAKHSLTILRTFLGKLKREFDKFEKTKLEKFKEETSALGKQWFNNSWRADEVESEMTMRSTVNQRNKIVSFLESSCDGWRFFEILKEFYENKVKELVDTRNEVVHNNEIQFAVNVESLVYSFNNAKYLLRYLKFIQGEGWFPVFLDYDFKLLNKDS